MTEPMPTDEKELAPYILPVKKACEVSGVHCDVVSLLN